MTETAPHATVLAGLAAARAVVSDQQTENGVVLIDLGGTTTNIAVFEEGDLQHVAVLPVGSVNITNDLAIGLKTDLDIAEAVKLQHAVAVQSARKDKKDTVSVKINDQTHDFETADIDMIVDARLEEIFELVNKELKSIGRAAKLPGGAVLTGGGAQLAGIADYAKHALQISARVGQMPEFAGVSDKVTGSAWSTAVGLMLIDLEGQAVGHHARGNDKQSAKSSVDFKKVAGKITGVFNKFRT
jgi:cell division protein FtsA